MIEDSFFRSMSLTEDLGEPLRFAHYQPTRRATPVLAAVMQAGKATMVIAPYGSGKSLAAGVAALAVRNQPQDREVVGRIIPSIDEVDPELGRELRERSESSDKGAVVALSGYVADPLAAITESLGTTRVPRTVEGLGKALRDGGWDHVAIIWDEFGRHLEGLVSEGRPDELDVLQRLAERCARASGPTMSLTLLLHQNLLSYASRLNETTRSEWKKVEGRFTVVRMIEDSQEIYQLVGQVVAGLRPAAPKEKVPSEVVRRVREARWLDGVEEQRRVEQVLADARPLTAGALQVLPTLVARVGQNERSLFTFLREVDLSHTIGIEEVYTAFADALRSDVGIGGAYRRWLETESARSRAKDTLQRELLAAACLLQLGSSGERCRLPRSVLELSVLRPGISDRTVTAAVDALLDANLLLWRRHNDDVAVWHGADIDVALRVKEERERQAIGFDLRRFLDDRFPAPNLRASGHNARLGVNRFFSGSYVTAAELDRGAPEPIEPQVNYVLARTRIDIEAARGAAELAAQRGRIIVVPTRPLEVESAAIELVALEALKADRDFVASDPMVTTELDELQSVAFEQLATLLRSLLDPRGLTAEWWAEGRRLPVSGDRPASMAASALLDSWYRLTPGIANEQLMRDRASRTMQTARVRVVGALLEHHDRERLGYDAGERSAESSIYRTVLERTGLHRSGGAGGWRIADPDEIEDEGLREAWSEIAWFFRSPTTSRGKPLSQLVEKLSSPPHGVPKAVLPILIAAGYKRFARTVALYKEGVYLPDLLGFQFDQLITMPEGIAVRVEQPDLKLINYLRELSYAFTHEHPSVDSELFRTAHDSIIRWRAGVPDGSKRTQKLDAAAKALLRAIDGEKDPVDLFLVAIPRAFGTVGADSSIIAALERTRIQIDGLADEFAVEAMTTVEEAFRAHGAASGLLDAVRNWARCFDLRAMDARGDLRISDKAVLRKAVETANGRFSPKSFAASLSSILLQRGLDRWDDRTAVHFRAALRETRERLETAALDTAQPGEELRPIISARLTELQALLEQIDAASENSTSGMKNCGGGL
ncbi:hypothetical protein [Sphingomonas sp.]|jgi:GNAT superfamily N-acetyltransferase|uniref:hypothetical protein n=1 Tax=Sphingomonas sp. TaxID=28214 RepID=UPI002DECE118|nr:hypothetical protein [Sphingomonas sp.]